MREERERRRIVGGEREGRRYSGEEDAGFTEKTYGVERFLTDLLFQCCSNPICVYHCKSYSQQPSIMIPTSPTWSLADDSLTVVCFCFKELFLSSAMNRNPPNQLSFTLSFAPVCLLLRRAHLMVSAREIPNFLCVAGLYHCASQTGDPILNSLQIPSSLMSLSYGVRVFEEVDRLLRSQGCCHKR